MGSLLLRNAFPLITDLHSSAIEKADIALAAREQYRRRALQASVRHNVITESPSKRMAAAGVSQDALQYSVSGACERENAQQNRYSDILPYDLTRVILPVKVGGSNSAYVNANHVSEHQLVDSSLPRLQQWIATQGPLPHTVPAFLSLFLDIQPRPAVVVQLCAVRFMECF